MKVKFIECQRCHNAAVRRGPVQKYCEPCSAIMDQERKNKWTRENRPNAKQKKRHRETAGQRQKDAREYGARVNEEARKDIAWIDTSRPDLLWIVRIAVPFSYSASKNHIYSMGAGNHVSMRKESKAMKSAIAAELRAALAGRDIAHNKLWVDIFVQKPDHRGDGINVVDLVCDAIQDATGLNDRWYSIRRLDWEIAKDNPCMYIGIGQESRENAQVCSLCGLIKTLDNFHKSRGNYLGVSRECKKCKSRGK